MTAEVHPPVFIGNFRSGTTLLVNILGFHDEVAPWYETKGFCEALRWLRVLERPDTLAFESRLIRPRELSGFTAESVAARMREDFRQTDARMRGEIESGKGGHEFYPLGHDRLAYSLDEAEAAVNQWYEAVRDDPCADRVRRATGKMICELGALHAECSGRPIWVNKTPEMPRFAHELRSCIGPCRILMMMRDRNDVVRSAVRLGWAEPQEIADWCQGMINESRAAAEEDPSNYLELHYEALLQDPAAVIDQLLRFVGVAETGEKLVQRYDVSLPSGARTLCPGSAGLTPGSAIADNASLR